MTMTLAMVYIPIGFLSGMTGVLFKGVRVHAGHSGAHLRHVALTLSPVMSSRVAPEQGREAGMTRRVNRVFDNARQGYRRLLDGLLANNGPILFCAVFFALLAVPFFMLSQKELAPTEDQGEMNIAYTAPPEASLEYTERYMTDVVNAMESLPGSGRMWQMVLTNAGFGGMKFVDFDERELSTGEMLTMAFQGALRGDRSHRLSHIAVRAAERRALRHGVRGAVLGQRRKRCCPMPRR